MSPIRCPARAAGLIPLRRLSENTPFIVDRVHNVYRRGWPTPSARPWHLYDRATGKFLAAYATPEALERSLRTRLGLTGD